MKKNNLKILFLGDFCPSADLSKNFFLNPIFKVDHILVNLEGVLIFDREQANFKFGKRLLIDANEFMKLIKPIKNKVIFTMTNNHSLDLGFIQYQKNVEFFTKYKIKCLTFKNPSINISGLKITSVGFTESKFDIYIRKFLKNPFKTDVLLIHDGFEGFSSWFLYDWLQAQSLFKYANIIIRSHSHEIGPVLKIKNKYFFNGIGDLNFTNMRITSKGRAIQLNLSKKNIRLKYFDFLSTNYLSISNFINTFSEDIVMKRTLFNNNRFFMVVYFLKKYLIDNISLSSIKAARDNHKYSFWSRLKCNIVNKNWIN
jgi:hypothetical protein